MDFQEHDNPHDSRDFESRQAEREQERFEREQVVDEPPKNFEEYGDNAGTIINELNEHGN